MADVIEQSPPSDRLVGLQDILRSHRDEQTYSMHLGEHVMAQTGVVLDIGSGDGGFAHAVNSDPEANAKVIAIDPSYLFRPAGNRHTGEVFDQPNVAAFGQELPLADKSVNAVITGHMFIHIDRRTARTVVKEALRVLVPEGTLTTTIYTRDRKLPHTEQTSDRAIKLTKPLDYAMWSAEERDRYARRMARMVSPNRFDLAVNRILWRLAGVRAQNGYELSGK